MTLHQRGFSLIELVMFIVIVGIAVSAIVTVYTTNVIHSPEPLIREKTLKIASLYMDEIMGKRWDENTPVGGGCIDTAGSAYCTNYCASLTFPNCDFCSKSGGACVPPASIAAMGTNEELLRSDFDDVDDYRAAFLSATPSYPDPAGVNGETALTDVSGYQVSVTITEEAFDTVIAPDVRKVEVRVTNPLGDTLTLRRYRTNF